MLRSIADVSFLTLCLSVVIWYRDRGHIGPKTVLWVVGCVIATLVFSRLTDAVLPHF